MSVSEVVHHDAGHDHGEHSHDHPEWLAHHFDDAEQQFDSGKLGMWLFLVTEVLFFSGMFCAYALLRSQSPETFAFASQFLNEKLGAINTGVLLFSSLTMAWAVRASQLSQHRILVGMLGTTLGCASVFLGVKAVEYTHKWGLGLLPGSLYRAQGVPTNEDHAFGELALVYLCVIPGILAVGFLIWWLISLVKKDRVQIEISGPLFLAAACFFGGVGLGRYLESGEAHAEHADHTAQHDTHATDHAAEHADAEHAGEHVVADAKPAVAATAGAEVKAIVETASQAHPDQVAPPKFEGVKNADVNQKGRAGLFFSIYYCMTGVHAFHIIGGMIVLTWLIVKAARHEFHSKYFGPVDNVGLYWHLVDFIWIYLFPLLYLIG
jgi:cytochrome c oxidase subunit III